MRQLRGDAQRPPAPVILPAPTDAPEDLTAEQRAYWDAYAVELHRLGRLTLLSEPLLVDLCRWMVMADEMHAKIGRDGLTVAGQKSEQVRHPLLPILLSLAHQVNVIRTAFGMSPLAAERFELSKPENDSSDLLAPHDWPGRELLS